MYRIFDFLIESNIPLPELPEVDKGAPSISFHCSSKFPSANGEPRWFHHWRLPDGEITISCAMAGGDYYLRFPQLADFLISEKGDDIRCFPFAGVPDGTVRHLLLDQVVPRVVGHQGRVVLHASAVSLEQGGAAFMGETGWGKSTLAASFHQIGYPLLTDDCLLLQAAGKDIIGIPSYAGSRLWADSLEAVMDEKSETHQVAHFSSKKRLILHRDADVSCLSYVAVRALFVLGKPQEMECMQDIVIAPIRGGQGLMELLGYAFVLDLGDKAWIARQFSNVGRLANSGMGMYRLVYLRDHERLPEVREAVIAAVSG